MSELQDAMMRVLERNHVTFAELSRLEGFSGPAEIISDKYKNIILWCGISLEAYTILDGLLVEGKVRYRPAHPLSYLIDGFASPIPLATQCRDYAKPHWLPMVINHGPKWATEGDAR